LHKDKREFTGSGTPAMSKVDFQRIAVVWIKSLIIQIYPLGWLLLDGPQASNSIAYNVV
jgi:hypothetical protein